MKICNHLFALLKERNEEHNEKAEQARALREEGMTMRRIAGALGRKSITAIHTLLNQE